MSFDAVKDQAVAIRLLQNMLRRGRTPNALLFWGPEGVGKRLAAFEFVKALHCREKEDDACDACASCRKVEHNTHPDVTQAAPKKKSRVIDVETVEYINEMASLKPYQGAWRVFVILEADRMNLAGQNHFLKTLEEPPGASVFILITERPRFLLPTIQSRCQHVRFGPVTPETVAGVLARSCDLPEATVQAIAAVSQGQVARALAFAASEQRDGALDLTRRLAEGEDPVELAAEFVAYLKERKDRIGAATKAEWENLEKQEIPQEDLAAIRQQEAAAIEARVRRDIMEFLYILETWYRDELVYAATGDAAHMLNRDQIDRIEAAASSAREEKLSAIEQARVYLERNLTEGRVFRDLFFILAD